MLNKIIFSLFWLTIFSCDQIETANAQERKLEVSKNNTTLGNNMNGFITNIEKDTIANKNYRKVIYTANNSQLVLMSLKPLEDIGEEEHDVDQFVRVEAGEGKVVINGK